MHVNKNQITDRLDHALLAHTQKYKIKSITPEPMYYGIRHTRIHVCVAVTKFENGQTYVGMLFSQD
jgi:hypothetical protein